MKLPLGYRYSAVYAGIRKQKSDDVMLIVSSRPAAAAAVFTQNVVQAAPVQLARKNLRAARGRVSAVLVNAGNANCATRTGDRVALASCRAVAKALSIPAAQVFPASTGVIGVELNPKFLTDAVPQLVSRLSSDRFEDAAKSILTTDTRMKVAHEEVPVKGGVVRIAGMTKGSGMIHPNMATTLGFIMTDAALSPKDLRPMLVRATARSYNALTVDGDTSTNDVLLLMANGASGLKLTEKEKAAFEEALVRVAESLSKQIAADGEGAKKLIRIEVSGAKTESDARQIARAIANSPLVKTAVAGSDPNWGRILTAAGYSGVRFNPADVDIYVQGQLVCRNGLAAKFDEDRLKKKLDAAECEIKLVMRGRGRAEARFWTCDFTEGYIRINASYRT